MPNPNLTHILVVLDRSGSMNAVREATIGGLNQFFQDQTTVPGDVRLTLVQFDDRYEVFRQNVDLKTMPLLTQVDFLPRGWTALYDAIGRGMTDLGEELAKLPEEQRPGQVIVVIQTDGQENASHTFSQSQIFDMIKHQTDKYSWKFIFLGANQDAYATSRQLGVPLNMTLSYNANAVSSAKVFQATSQQVANTRSGGTYGATLDSFANYVKDDTVQLDTSLNNSTYKAPEDDKKDSGQT